MKIIFAIFLSFFKFLLCNEIFNINDVKKIYTRQQANEMLKDSQRTYFVMYYSPESDNSVTTATFIKEMMPKLDGIVQMVYINCLNSDFMEESVCAKPENVKDGFPRMLLLIPPKNRLNPYTKVPNKFIEKKYENKEVSPKLIYKFITENIPDYSTELTNENIDDFLSNTEYNKIILFTDKDKTPLLFRALSGIFYDRLHFGIVKKEQKDIHFRFKLYQFPTLLMYNVIDEGVHLIEPAVDIYSGGLNALDLIANFELIALSEKKYVTLRNLEEAKQNKTETNNQTTYTDKHFGIHKVNGMLLGHYINRQSTYNLIMQLRNMDPIDPFLVKLAKKLAGFVTILDIDCSIPSIKEYMRKEMNTTCPNPGNSEISYVLRKQNTLTNVKQTELHLLMTKIEKPSYKAFVKVLYEIYPPVIHEIISDDYNYARIQALKEGKIPVFYFYDNVRIF